MKLTSARTVGWREGTSEKGVMMSDTEEKARKYREAQQLSPVHVEVSQHGRFRIVAYDKRGKWAGYRGIAMLEHEGQFLIAVTEYFAGGPLLPRVVYACQPVFC